jgi:hypothetical protein
VVSLLLRDEQEFGAMDETFQSPNGFSAREKALRARVLEYLWKHPQAMDTLDGIAEWWVPLKGESIDRTELRNVLRSLTADGLLEEVDSGSNTRFSLVKRRQSVRPESEPG